MRAAGTPVCSRNALPLRIPLDQCFSRPFLLVQLCQRCLSPGSFPSYQPPNWLSQLQIWARDPRVPIGHLPTFAAYGAMEQHLRFASHPAVVLKYLRFLVGGSLLAVQSWKKKPSSPKQRNLTCMRPADAASSLCWPSRGSSAALQELHEPMLLLEHPCCGQHLGWARSWSPGQHSMKCNHQPDWGTRGCFSSNTAHIVSVDWNCCRKTSSSPPKELLLLSKATVYYTGQHFSIISPSKSLEKVACDYTACNGWSSGCPWTNIHLAPTL